jgi:hypothetical protein
MDLMTLRAFRDELVKIAVDAQEPTQAPQTMAVNSSTYPMTAMENNSDWRQKRGRMAAKEQEQAKVPDDQEKPARKANNLFGLPETNPPQRKVRMYDQGSAAAQNADRSQSPIDAQSSANIASGGVMQPTAGPGGV